jgi:serine/arginine repetitive matrix protein 2
MYNGIGLKTPRGSGTNGYVVRNLSFLRPRQNNTGNVKPEDVEPPKPRPKPTDQVLIHREKRQIEIDLLELRDELERDGELGAAEIEAKIAGTRKKLLARLEEKTRNNKEQVLAVEKEKEMTRLKDAFGIDKDYEEGQAFQFETKKVSK